MISEKHYLAFSAILLVAVIIFTAGCTSTPTATSSAVTHVSTTATLSPQVTAMTSAPSVVGVWTGTTIGHTRLHGFRETNTPRYNFTEQKGSAFTGFKDFTRADGSVYHEHLSGVISRDGEISIAGHNAGVTVGKFIGPNEIELIFTNDGADARALIIHLTRQAS